MARDLMDGEIEAVRVEFDPHGSLATTHESQGSDMGLCGGLLGWDATHERLADAPGAIREVGIRVEMEITPINASHPNTYQMTLTNPRESHAMTAISTGGGIIEVIAIDGIKVSLAGDYFETLIYCEENGERLLAFLKEKIEADEIHLLRGGATQFIEIKWHQFLDGETIRELRSRFAIQSIKQIAPVLPVLSRRRSTRRLSPVRR